MVPVDESLDPQRALRTAFSLAERASCTVTLVSACPTEEADDAVRALREAGTRFGAIAPYSTRVLEGPPVDAIAHAASTSGAMICMPTHARDGLTRLVFGSLAEDLIRRSAQPILCVGPDVTDIALPKERIEALVCTDDSAATDRVLDAAAVFAKRVDANCVVAQVVGPDEDVSPGQSPPPQPIREQAEHHCRQGADRLGDQGITATAQVLHGDVVRSIVQHASHQASSFVVVGTSGKTGLTRYALGSVAIGVVRHARCPVLVVPALTRSD